jgi:F-type H+-transporting ATPase subunit b
MGIFFATYLVLNQLVFKPYLALIHAREGKTSGLKEKAIQQKEEAEKLKASYEIFMKEERKKINAVVDQERSKVAEEERAIIGKARAESNEELGKVRKTIDAESKEARKQLQSLVNDYSSEIVSKLVGKPVKVPASMKAGASRETEQVV